MSIIHRISLALALTGALGLVACGGDEEEATGSSATSETAEAPAPEPEPEPTEPTRLVTAETLERTGDGPFRFRLTSQAEAPISRMQAWVYYYDADGECVSRYPHAFSASIAPGASVEQELGRDGDDLPEGATQADVEISRVTFEDGTEWTNENLVEWQRDRVMGGLSHEELLARTGELITGEWTGEYGGEDDRPVLTLHNTTDEPLEPRVVWVYYYDSEGDYVSRDVINLMGTTIAPGADHTLEGGDSRDEMDEEMRYIEVYVSRIDRADGTSWENRNLSAPFREMSHPPEQG